MFGMLIAYNAAGEVIATLGHVVRYDAEGNALGLVDFTAHEAAGRPATDLWVVDGAAGSKVWPEYLGSRAHEYRVELEGEPGAKRIARLVHRTSGRVRFRDAIEAALAAVQPDELGRRDVRHLIGGPDRPLRLDDEDVGHDRHAKTPGPELPLITLNR